MLIYGNLNPSSISEYITINYGYAKKKSHPRWRGGGPVGTIRVDVGPVQLKSTLPGARMWTVELRGLRGPTYQLRDRDVFSSCLGYEKKNGLVAKKEVAAMYLRPSGRMTLSWPWRSRGRYSWKPSVTCEVMNFWPNFSILIGSNWYISTIKHIYIYVYNIGVLYHIHIYIYLDMM